MNTLTLDEYAALVGRLADDAMASLMEIVLSVPIADTDGEYVSGLIEAALLVDEDHQQISQQAFDLVEENTFEEIVGFGSPLDVGLRGGNEDTFALSVLIHSKNRHVVMTSERCRRLAGRKRIASLFVGDDCIDYRFLAACALHADVITAFIAKAQARIDAEHQENLALRQAVPFE